MARKGGTPENLIPAKKGEVRNPKGRTPILPEIREAYNEFLSKEEGGKTRFDKLLESIYQRALKGDIRAAQEFLDRYYGKAKQEVDITSKGEKINPLPTVINVTYEPKPPTE